ncbi:hypothetical protein K7G98_06465 [Saccharothrix sp. MB29]|nr:hypothetical protein [Saccharothrix sp. MB29]
MLRGADAVVHLAWRIQPSHDERTSTRRTWPAATACSPPPWPRACCTWCTCRRSGPTRRPPRTTPWTRWPTDGVSTSYYSRQKAAVEHILDQVERDHLDAHRHRVRPGLRSSRRPPPIKRYSARSCRTRCSG